MKEAKYTCIAVKWFDKINGNTYHSINITKHKDVKIIACPITYGYDDAYKQTALKAMLKADWLPKKYNVDNLYLYERENKYPIIWVVFNSSKRDCIINGTV